MKITGYALLFIAAILYADLAAAAECESKELYRTCIYAPGEFVFADPAELQEFIDSKGLVFHKRGETTITPNARNLSLGSVLWIFVNHADGAVYGVIQRAPGSTVELLAVSLAQKGA